MTEPAPDLACPKKCGGTERQIEQEDGWFICANCGHGWKEPDPALKPRRPLFNQMPR